MPKSRVLMIYIDECEGLLRFARELATLNDCREINGSKMNDDAGASYDLYIT